MALQADGKIIAVGGIGYSSEAPSDFVVMRFTTDGTLDTSFGPDQTGIVFTNFQDLETDTNDVANSVTIDSHDRIVVAGESSYQTFFPDESSATSSDFVVARYTPLGDLDDSFGNNNGEVRLDVNQESSYDSAARIVTQTRLSDIGTIDSYVIAGTVGPYNGPATARPTGAVTSSYDTSTNDFAMVRLDESGNQDTSFGDGDLEGLNGLVEEDFGQGEAPSDDFLSGMDVDPATGNIWLSGSNDRGLRGHRLQQRRPAAVLRERRLHL